MRSVRLSIMRRGLALLLWMLVAPALAQSSQSYDGSPPLAARAPDIGVDLIAHWYNDFGLESTRQAKGMLGWEGWYDWRWNIRDGRAKDSRREPLQGWFHGDDPHIIDWQCYWLSTSGIRAVTLNPTKGLSLSAWEETSNPTHWIYQYLNHAPNCRRLPYMLFGMSEFGRPAAEHEAAWQDVLAVMRKYPSYYSIRDRGRTYPCLYIWEGEALRGAFDNFKGARGTIAFLTRIAGQLRKQGHGGVCLLVRHATGADMMPRAALKAAGVLYIPAEYSGVSGEKGGAATMSELTAQLAAPSDGGAVSIVTARQSVAEHPSGFKLEGDTPAAFERMLSKAIRIVRTNPRLPRIVTIYSVWEWAEGGPNLAPSRGDGFAYLDAVKRVVQKEKKLKAQSAK